MLYDRWRRIAREARAEIALIDSSSGKHWTFQQLAAAAEQDPAPRSAVVFPRGMSSEFVLSVLRGWRRGSLVCPLEEGQPDVELSALPREYVHLKMTSASTGMPRFIAFKAEQLIADVDQIVTTMALRPEWPNLGVISLAHSYGFSNLVLPLLLHGIPLILASSLPESLRQAAQRAPRITLPAVPALWRAWLQAGALSENVRMAISAGAPLPVSVEEEAFQRHGLKIRNFYGASECGGIAFDQSATPRQNSACVGTPMHNVRLSSNDAGCLRVHSLAVGQTYWPDADESLGQGCYQTSDLGRIEQDLVYLSGRKTDQINVAGRKVSPETIERVLEAHPEVRACLVFGIPSPDQDRTEMIIACVEAGPAASPESLRDYLVGHLPAWQLPRDWWFVPALPSNQRGKLARGEWRERYLKRQSR